MKSLILASVLALTTSIVSAQVFNQSAPFNLVIISTNATLNGSSLISCHEGAAIEGLCAPTTTGLSNSTGSLYQLNTTDTGLEPNITIGEPGVLTYELQGSNFNYSEPMNLAYYPTSNVALPLFEPGYDATQVAFDNCEKMNIQGYVDDTSSPPKFGPSVAYYRWVVCTTYYSSYTYQTLAWVVGDGEAQNPTCQKVDVVRVFV